MNIRFGFLHPSPFRGLYPYQASSFGTTGSLLVLRLDIVLQLVRSRCRSAATSSGGSLQQAIATAIAATGGGGAGRGSTSGGCCGYVSSSAATRSGGGGRVGVLRRDCVTSTTAAAAVAVGATCRRGAEIFGVLARIGRVAGVADTVEASISLFPESVIAVLLRLRRVCCGES